MKEFLVRYFRLEQNHTDIKTELMAGVTTFMSMAYILAVIPNSMSTVGMDAGSVLVATALIVAFSTLLMAFTTNYPFALAPGLGLNAFFTSTVCGSMGYSWHVALTAVFLEGLLFIILSLTRVRELLFECFPISLKHGVTAGVGFFVALIGLRASHLVVPSDNLISIFPFHQSVLDGSFFTVGIGALLALVGVMITAVFMIRKISGSILWGMLITWGIGVICELSGLYRPNPAIGVYSVIPDLSNLFSIPSLSPTFMQLDFSMIFQVEIIYVIAAFFFVDIFETMGCLIGLASKGGMLEKDGKLPKIKGALLTDSLATTCGSMLGLSTITPYVESTSGISAGGRTGLTGVTVAVLFLLSLFAAPIFLAIPAFATAPALILVGYSMLGSLNCLDYSDAAESVPAYLAAIGMGLMNSISEGVALGTISYVVLHVLSGNYRNKKVSPVLYIVAVLFVLKYILM